MAKQTVSTKKTTTNTRVSFNLNKALSNLTGQTDRKGSAGGGRTTKRCPSCGKFMGGGSR